MTYIAIALLLAAAGLRMRLVRLWRAVRLFRAANALREAGSHVLDHVEREAGQ